MSLRYYSDKEHVEIAAKEYEDWKLGYDVYLEDGKFLGIISQVINNPSGEQSFVITHTDRFVSPVVPLPERLVR
ncbi:hypothetical protein [Enterococcus lactis]|uniref:hypothetical protein n=1 Tax=Enterococcus lactis TaxID=357441 RepID=UPI0034E965D1